MPTGVYERVVGRKYGRPVGSSRTEEERKEARKKISRNSHQKLRDENPEQNLIYSCRRRAKRKKLEFDITREDIIIPDRCPYFGTPFQLKDRARSGPSDFGRSRWPTLDRIDNTKGYIKGNVQVISWLANTIKGRLTKEELVAFANKVLEIHGE